jgi:hypothetical protein
MCNGQIISNSKRFIALGKQAIPYNKLWILKFLTPFPKFDL